MSESNSNGSSSSYNSSDDDELYMNAAFLCASAIKNGWLSDIVSSSSSNDEQDTSVESEGSETSADCDDNEPITKKFKAKVSQRDLDLMSCINTLKPDPDIFTPKLDLFRRKVITPNAFDKLFRFIETDISKKATCMRMPIPAEDKLAAVLRYFMSGCNFKDIEIEAKISRPALSAVIPNVCDAILKNIGPKYMSLPSSHEEWMEIAADYEAIWHFPLCLGAIDVRHIPVRCARKEKNIYQNSLKYSSITIVALCDAHYCFRFVDVGCMGRFSDEEALLQSDIQQIISNTNGELPPDREIGKYSRLMPHVFVTDEALPLEKHLMTPFDLPLWTHYQAEATSFNMRLNSARQTIDLALGKLWNRFPILQTCILQAEKVAKVVEACCVLHNFLTKENEADVDAIDFESLTLQSDTKVKCDQETCSDIAAEVRRQFTEYFYYEDPMTITE